VVIFLLLVTLTWTACGTSVSAEAAPTAIEKQIESHGTEQESTADVPATGRRLGGFAHVSERVLQMLLRREVKQNQSIVESILKMTTSGTAYAECNIGLDLIPNSQMANLRLTMHGRATMDDAVSTMRRIRIHSSSYTSIAGQKDIFFEPKGFRLSPTQVNCNTSIEVHDIEAGRLVERMAWRRVNQMQPEAERAAAERAARRAEQQLEEEAGTPLSHLHEEYVQNVYEPLVSKGALPDTRLITTDDRLAIMFYRSDDKNGGEDDDSSKLPIPSYDIAACLNDNFVNEMAARTLSGRTVTDEQLGNLMLTLVGKTPHPLWVHANADRWRIVAAAERPLDVSFADDLVSITLRIAEVYCGERGFHSLSEVSAKYSLEITQDGPHLIRVGDVEVKLAESSATAGEIAQWQQLLRRKFSGVFLSELYFDGLTPPAGGTWGKLRRLELKKLSAREGWFAVGYEMHEVHVAQKKGATATK
jgi:hypothetical protein